MSDKFSITSDKEFVPIGRLSDEEVEKLKQAAVERRRRENSLLDQPIEVEIKDE